MGSEEWEGIVCTGTWRRLACSWSALFHLSVGVRTSFLRYLEIFQLWVFSVNNDWIYSTLGLVFDYPLQPLSYWSNFVFFELGWIGCIHLVIFKHHCNDTCVKGFVYLYPDEPNPELENIQSWLCWRVHIQTLHCITSPSANRQNYTSQAPIFLWMISLNHCSSHDCWLHPVATIVEGTVIQLTDDIIWASNLCVHLCFASYPAFFPSWNMEKTAKFMHYKSLGAEEIAVNRNGKKIYSGVTKGLSRVSQKQFSTSSVHIGWKCSSRIQVFASKANYKASSWF